jgi:hypothetical protein
MKGSRLPLGALAALALLLSAAVCVAAAAPVPAPKKLTEYPDMPPTKLVIPTMVGNSPDAAVLSGDGKWVFVADAMDGVGPCVSVFDAASGHRVRQMVFSKDHPLAAIRTIRVSADGKVLVASGEHAAVPNTVKTTLFIKVWDIPGFRERRTFSEDLQGLKLLDLSSDGRILAGGIQDSGNGSLRVWDLTTGKPLIKQDKIQDMGGCCLSPDGKSFVWFGAASWHLVDTASGAEKGSANYPPKFRQSIGGISPDGKTMVSVGDRGTMIWDVTMRTARSANALRSLYNHPPQFLADGKTALVAAKAQVIYLDTATGQPTGAITAERPKYTPWISSSGDGRLLLTAGASVDRVRLFDASKLEPPPPMPPPLDEKALGTGEIPEFDNGGATPKNGKKPAKSPEITAKPSEKSPSPTTAPSAIAGTGNTGNSSKPPPIPTPPQPAADPAMPLLGTWTAEETGLHESWTISRTGNDWKVTCVYKKASADVGSAHGENVKFEAGVLTFTRVFDKKPSNAFHDNSACTVQIKGERLDYVSTVSGKTKHMLLRRG